MIPTIIEGLADTGDQATLRGVLEDAGYRVVALPNGAEAQKVMEENHFDVVVVDVNLSGIGGLGVLRLAREVNPDAAVIVITDYAGEGTAVAAANQGAYACFVRPLNPGEIKDAIANALKQQKLMQENRRLTNGLRGSNRLLFQANKKLQDAMTGHERRQKRFTEKKAKLKPPEEEAK